MTFAYNVETMCFVMHWNPFHPANKVIFNLNYYRIETMLMVLIYVHFWCV